ncbi:MAG: hypothetical protein IPL65_14470 [Lewinellaceae bacterium]|nr:hypothetical protein [Lewinellaceae bacterium]
MKNKSVRIIATLCCFCCGTYLLPAQSGNRLTLQDVRQWPKKVNCAQQATTEKETRYWEYKTYQSNFKPQLLLDSRIPASVRSFREVVNRMAPFCSNLFGTTISP